MDSFYKASLLTLLLLLQSTMICLAISSSNFTDQLALLSFKSAITYDPNNILGTNWTENSNFCDWFGVRCSRRRQRVTALRLYNKALQGTISAHIGNLSFLVELDLRNNSFHGHLAPEIGHLRRLKVLILQHNLLEGNIPLSLYNCRELQVISLVDNKFTRGIPKELDSLPFLRVLSLGSNKLGGTMPTSLGNISRLEILAVEDNNIYGNIPAEVGHLPNLVGLYLSENYLSGIAPEIFNISSLYTINLDYNQFYGNLPSTTGHWLPNLEIFRAFGNQLSGHIPAYLSNSSMLTFLGLSGNLFTGELPASLGQLRFLDSLLLRDNQLTGQIPREIGFLKILTRLVLTNNSLTGTIPSTLGGLESLQRLYLDSNNIEGSIPSEICFLSNLGELDLQRNKLSGSIPSCIGNLTYLKKLALSSNALSSIPASLWNLEDLISLNLSFNSLGGSLEGSLKAGNVLESMDIAWNRISGNMPSSIGAFGSLTYLNMSGNLLSGPIPQSLGELITLDFLDLSHNNLSGAIPKSLEALSHLKYFNLSFNQLSGQIPSGGLFRNLTAQSFMANEALCGKPILQVRTCTKDTSKNSTKTLMLKYILPAISSVVTLALVFYVAKSYQRRNSEIPSPTGSLVTPEQRLISYHELRQATNDFCDDNLIGAGSFGSVYRGILLDGTSVAIKVLNLQLEGAFKSFDAECKVLRATRHRNLVKIISTCSNPELRAFILQYMPNGSLEKWLHSQNFCLDLLQRVSIMLDVALGLEYLHHGQSEAVVHCDLKPGNILLDDEMIAHVGDFGIAKILEKNKTATQTSMLGTLGYIAPEYGCDGRVSTKGDVYSYGIMLLETFTRKKPTDEMFNEGLHLKQWVKESLPEGIMEVTDSELMGIETGEDMIATQSILLAIMELGLECSKEEPNERIDIKEVAVKLNKIKLQVLRTRGT